MKKTAFLIVIIVTLTCLAACNSGSGLTLTVMSFNIRYATEHDGMNQWENRKDLVYDVIRTHSPDIIGLQEALRSQLDDLREALADYSEIGEGRDGGTKGEYSSILYKPENFDITESGTFWLSDTPDTVSSHWGNACIRICTWARFIDKGTKRAFYFYNTHLDHQSQPSREKSVRLIADRIANRSQTDPYILTGDFNAGENNPAIEYLKGIGDAEEHSDAPLRDTFRVLYPDEDRVGTSNGFKGRAEGKKIDYVFVPASIQTVEAAIIRTEKDSRYPSDHFPVTAQVVIK